jgi:hypothetical protein
MSCPCMRYRVSPLSAAVTAGAVCCSCLRRSTGVWARQACFILWYCGDDLLSFVSPYGLHSRLGGIEQSFGLLIGMLAAMHALSVWAQLLCAL